MGAWKASVEKPQLGPKSVDNNMKEREMRKLVAVVLLGALCLTHAHGGEGTTATVFGIAEGDKLPEKCVNTDTGIDDVLKTAVCPSQAGFDHVLVLYTGNQGVCKVVGFVVVSRPRSDDYGSRHKRVADELKDRVVAKLGGNPPSSQYDVVWDNFWDEAKYWINALVRKSYSFPAWD